MRTPLTTVLTTLGLALAGCTSGVTVVRQPPPPRPVPVVIEPLEVDLARPHNGKIYVQTNRPAYVAVFDIIPERGVALVYPVSARQRRYVVSGLREVPVWWESSRVTYRAGGIVPSRSEPARYVYVLASDAPLRLPDEAFDNGYLYEALGPRAYRATNPYATMRALARQFLPNVAEEAWAEDAYGVSRSYATERYRVVRVYCRDGSMYEVPAEFGDRVWCGSRNRGVGNGPGRVYDVDLTSSERPVRPDSIVGDNGRRLAMRTRGENGRGPIRRVQEPPGFENRPNGRDDKAKDEPQGHAPPGNKPGNVRRPALIPERVETQPSTENAVKPETVVRKAEPDPKAETKTEIKNETKNEAKNEAKNEPKSETKAEEKSESASDKRGGAEKGRGRPNASDDKTREKKSKQAPDTVRISPR